MRTGVWLAATVLAVATSATTLAVLETASPAAADVIGQCSTTVGEIVVVDFSKWGGPIIRGCDAKLTTGFNALSAAGFITQGTEEDGPGFICRIGLAARGVSSEEPSPAKDSCVDTPPATAYWSYWHADIAQDTWSYSEEGPLDYQPAPGSVDAWVFGATNLSGTSGGPSFPPSAVRATNTSPTPPASTVPPSTVVTHTSQPAPTSTTSTPPPTTKSTIATSKQSGGGPAKRPRPSGGTSTDHSTTTTIAPVTKQSNGDPHPDSASGTSPADAHLPKIVTIGPTSAVGALPPTGNSAQSFEVGASVVGIVAIAGGVLAWRRRHNSGLK
jgi:hypothetical protein